MLRCFPHIVVIKTEKENVGGRGGSFCKFLSNGRNSPMGYVTQF